MLVLVGMLMSVVLAALYASARLVATANTDSDPTVFGTLSASVARLEGSLVAQQRCTNPPREALRSRCVQVETLGVPRQDPGTPGVSGDDFSGVPHPDGRAASSREACWVVADPAAVGDPRRLECWEVTEAGVVTASVHTHAVVDDGGVLLADTGDLLAIRRDQWQPDPVDSRPVGFGVRLLRWEVTDAAVVVCAAVRPGQRVQMRDENVPFCDGTTGVLAAGVSRGVEDLDVWGTVEGILLPAMRFSPGALR